MEGSGNFDRWQIGRWEGRTGQELSELSVRVDAGHVFGLVTLSSGSTAYREAQMTAW